jgi:hypothetical protein
MIEAAFQAVRIAKPPPRAKNEMLLLINLVWMTPKISRSAWRILLELTVSALIERGEKSSFVLLEISAVRRSTRRKIIGQAVGSVYSENS